MGSKNRVRIMCKNQDLDDDRPLLLRKKRTRRSSSFASFPSFTTPPDSSKNSNSSILSCVGISSLSKRLKNVHRNLVTLVVGEERRAFQVEPQILDHGVVQCLLEKTKSQLMEGDDEEEDKENYAIYENRRRIRALRSSRSMDRRDHHMNGLRIRVDCDAILFEHILWLLSNDDPSLRYLNVDELMEFYS